tara:strand:+ start:1658 stop:2335 length:678 start_codon:yes stop_codon:yes gene_type:complete
MKTIIIIPYRDRMSHLEYFLKNSYPELNKKINNLEILIVEQNNGKKFNRGLMINIGYQYYNNDKYDYITQDVDVNPILEESFDMYNYNLKNNEIYAIYSDENTLGGLVKFKGCDYKNLNGFPNDFWGWGCEDKELLNRAEFKNIKIKRSIGFHDMKSREKYFLIFQDNHLRERNDKYGESYILWNRLSNEQKNTKLHINGLTTLNYKIICEENLFNNVKKITVEV